MFASWLAESRGSCQITESATHFVVASAFNKLLSGLTRRLALSVNVDYLLFTPEYDSGLVFVDYTFNSRDAEHAILQLAC